MQPGPNPYNWKTKNNNQKIKALGTICGKMEQQLNAQIRLLKSCCDTLAPFATYYENLTSEEQEKNADSVLEFVYEKEGQKPKTLKITVQDFANCAGVLDVMMKAQEMQKAADQKKILLLGDSPF